MNNKCFLSIGQTHESTESTGYKKYIGIGSSFVLAVNPTKEELSNIYNIEIANDPVYTIDKTEQSAEGIKIEFIVKTDPAIHEGIETITRMPFFVYNEAAYTKDKTRIQVIDIYGNSTYAPVEDVKEHKELLNKNGNKAKMATSYRPAYRGEADLVAFLKSYLGVEDAFRYNDNIWTLRSDTANCIFGLEHIKDYFSGNVEEVKEALSLQPMNKVKLLYGVRTTDKGQFQTICTHSNYIFKNNVKPSTLDSAAKKLAKDKLAGSFSNTEFEICPLKEYILKATDFSADDTAAHATEDDPFGSDSDLPWE